MVYLSAVQFVQLSHAFSALECWPWGQLSQAVALENGFKVGFAMNVPGEQHPKRAVLVPRFCHNVKGYSMDSHAPPQSVRVKPLFLNTLRIKKPERVRIVIQMYM